MITVRVNSLENTDANAKAGVMIRATSAANSPYVAILLTPAPASWSDPAPRRRHDDRLHRPGLLTAPYWLRLTRAGNTFTASYSTDGANFNVAPQVTINGFAANTLVGLATASHTTNTLSLASIGNVTVSNAAPTAPTPPPPPPTPSSPATPPPSPSSAQTTTANPP